MSNSGYRSNEDREQEPDSVDQERANPLSDLLGSLLGGARPEDGSTGGTGQGGGGLGDLIGSLLGGGGAGQQGPMNSGQGTVPGINTTSGPLDSLLGGGMGAILAPLLTPLIRPLAEKIGIPVETAQVVVMFVLSKILTGRTSRGASTQASPQQQDQSGSLTLEDLLRRSRAGEPVDTESLRRSGLTDELAQRTGLDPDTATQSLEEALSMMGRQMR